MPFIKFDYIEKQRFVWIKRTSLLSKESTTNKQGYLI